MRAIKVFMLTSRTVAQAMFVEYASHISWRTCDLAIKVSGLDYKALAAYLCEGVAWARLREIATKEPAHGGIWALQGHLSAMQGPLW